MKAEEIRQGKKTRDEKEQRENPVLEKEQCFHRNDEEPTADRKFSVDEDEI